MKRNDEVTPPPYPVSPADKANALSSSLRAAAKTLDETIPSFITGVAAMARLFEVASAALSGLDPQSGKIATALHAIATQLPAPALEVAADLRHVASQIDSGAIAVN